MIIFFVPCVISDVEPLLSPERPPVADGETEVAWVDCDVKTLVPLVVMKVVTTSMLVFGGSVVCDWVEVVV